MRNIVFFDIDGTLWDDRMEIAESTAWAVRTLRENGHYAFLCSGRSRANIQDARLLGIGFDGMVASCGAHIELHGKKVYEALLSEEKVTWILALLHRYGMPAVLEGPEYVYVDEHEFLDDPYVIHLRKVLGPHLKSVPDDHGQIVINKLSCSTKGADVAGFVKATAGVFDVILHDGDVAEVSPVGITKATGIEKVCRLLGIPHECTYAFGDSANDLDMLSYVAHGIAMGNGTPAAKAAAEYVTADVWHDGIATGLQKYGLI